MSRTSTTPKGGGVSAADGMRTQFKIFNYGNNQPTRSKETLKPRQKK